jgi:competence protein ComFB
MASGLPSWARRIRMKIQNYMEEVVQDELEVLLSERPNVCKCQKCRCDMMLYALNRLPPRYVLSDRGRVFTRLKEQEIQFKADVIKEVSKAIDTVSRNPQH